MSQTRFDRVLEWLKSGGFRSVGYFFAIGTVAAVAARVSYSHIRDVTLIAGQPADVAALLPLSVDGMLLAASLAMSQDKAKGLLPRGWARFGFWFGATISVLCNVADSLVHATEVIGRARAIVAADMLNDQMLLGLAIFVAILAPLLLLITVEIMARPGKPRAGQVVSDVAPKAATEVESDVVEAAREHVDAISEAMPMPGSPVVPTRTPKPPVLAGAKSAGRSGPQVSGPVRSPLDPNRVLWDGPPQV